MAGWEEEEEEEGSECLRGARQAMLAEVGGSKNIKDGRRLRITKVQLCEQ